MLTKYYLLPWFLVHSTGAFNPQRPKTLKIPVPAPNFPTHLGTSHFFRPLRWLRHPIPGSDPTLFFSNVMNVLLF